MNHSTLSLATHRPTAWRSTSVMRAVEGSRSSTLASRTDASVRICVAGVGRARQERGHTIEAALRPGGVARHVLGADHDDVLDTRDVRQRDDEQRRGAGDREQSRARADRDP